eukprot:259421_1
MSSLFKNSFQSKQLKKFTEITLKAIPSIQRDAIKPIYKTIKSGKNQDFDSIDSALHALERKRKIDLQIASYSNIINDKQNNTFSEVQSAKSHVVNLTTNDDTSQLLQQIERAFSLDKGSLSHPQSNNTHLIPSKSKRRSLSVTKSNGLPNIDHITKDSGSDTPAIDEIRANALRALSQSPKPTKDTTQQRERKRSSFITQSLGGIIAREACANAIFSASLYNKCHTFISLALCHCGGQSKYEAVCNTWFAMTNGVLQHKCDLDAKQHGMEKVAMHQIWSL